MKKYLALIALLSIGLTGCVSDTEYKELEERVARLEKMIGENRDVAIEQETSISNTQSSLSITDGTDQSEAMYVIDNFSAQEVIAECQYYFNNLPQVGSSYEEYFATMRVTPLDTYISDDYHLVECDFYKVDSDPSCDLIKWVTISGIQTEMDGSMGYNGNSISVTIGLTIQDYEKAEAIYNGLYNLVNNKYISEIYEDKKATEWELTGKRIDGYGVGLLNMSRTENDYDIRATYHIVLE